MTVVCSRGRVAPMYSGNASTRDAGIDRLAALARIIAVARPVTRLHVADIQDAAADG